jgi:hypothetical protein
MQAITSWADIAFSSTERDRHLEIRPVSQLNTWPMVSPVNASRRPSRDAAHHSGSGRMASPFPVGDFHLLFFASFPGALRVGSQAAVYARASIVRCTPSSRPARPRTRISTAMQRRYASAFLAPRLVGESLASHRRLCCRCRADRVAAVVLAS